jgi:hypothetical protein
MTIAFIAAVIVLGHTAYYVWRGQSGNSSGHRRKLPLNSGVGTASITPRPGPLKNCVEWLELRRRLMKEAASGG